MFENYHPISIHLSEDNCEQMHDQPNRFQQIEVYSENNHFYLFLGKRIREQKSDCWMHQNWLIIFEALYILSPDNCAEPPGKVSYLHTSLLLGLKSITCHLVLLTFSIWPHRPSADSFFKAYCNFYRVKKFTYKNLLRMYYSTKRYYVIILTATWDNMGD